MPPVPMVRAPLPLAIVKAASRFTTIPRTVVAVFIVAVDPPVPKVNVDVPPVRVGVTFPSQLFAVLMFVSPPPPSHVVPAESRSPPTSSAAQTATAPSQRPSVRLRPARAWEENFVEFPAEGESVLLDWAFMAVIFQVWSVWL